MSEIATVKETRVAKGAVVLFSSGEYSDYGLQGTFRALADFDLAAVTTEFRAMPPEPEPADFYGSDWETTRFLAFLTGREYLEEFHCREYHLGSYDFAPDWERK